MELDKKVGKQINIAIQEDRYVDAISLIRKELKHCEKTFNDDTHWLWACLSCAYYERRKYPLAVKYAQKAVTKSPYCPLSLWYHGSALDMWGRKTRNAYVKEWCLKLAELTFRKMLAMGWKRCAFMTPCGEGESKAKALLNDARYRLFLIYWHHKDYKNAAKWSRLHLSFRAKGQKSIYTKREVLRDIKLMEKERGNESQ